jgi:hypothetical protein
MEAIPFPKRRFIQDQQGATSQKTAFFIVTVVKTTNLTRKEKLEIGLTEMRL